MAAEPALALPAPAPAGRKRRMTLTRKGLSWGRSKSASPSLPPPEAPLPATPSSANSLAPPAPSFAHRASTAPNTPLPSPSASSAHLEPPRAPGMQNLGASASVSDLPLAPPRAPALHAPALQKSASRGSLKKGLLSVFGASARDKPQPPKDEPAERPPLARRSLSSPPSSTLRPAKEVAPPLPAQKPRHELAELEIARSERERRRAEDPFAPPTPGVRVTFGAEAEAETGAREEVLRDEDDDAVGNDTEEDGYGEGTDHGHGGTPRKDEGAPCYEPVRRASEPQVQSPAWAEQELGRRASVCTTIAIDTSVLPQLPPLDTSPAAETPSTDSSSRSSWFSFSRKSSSSSSSTAATTPRTSPPSILSSLPKRGPSPLVLSFADGNGGKARSSLSTPSPVTASFALPAGVRRLHDRTQVKIRLTRLGPIGAAGTGAGPNFLFQTSVQGRPLSEGGKEKEEPSGYRYPRSVNRPASCAEILPSLPPEGAGSLAMLLHRGRVLERVRNRQAGGMSWRDEIELEAYPDVGERFKEEIVRRMREASLAADADRERELARDPRVKRRSMPMAPLLQGVGPGHIPVVQVPNLNGNPGIARARTEPSLQDAASASASPTARLKNVPPHADPLALGRWGARRPFAERCVVWTAVQDEDGDEDEEVVCRQVGMGGGDSSVARPQSVEEGFSKRVKWSLSMVHRPRREKPPSNPRRKREQPEEDDLPLAVVQKRTSQGTALGSKPLPADPQSRRRSTLPPPSDKSLQQLERSLQKAKDRRASLGPLALEAHHTVLEKEVREEAALERRREEAERKDRLRQETEIKMSSAHATIATSRAFLRQSALRPKMPASASMPSLLEEGGAGGGEPSPATRGRPATLLTSEDVLPTPFRRESLLHDPSPTRRQSRTAYINSSTDDVVRPRGPPDGQTAGTRGSRLYDSPTRLRSSGLAAAAGQQPPSPDRNSRMSPNARPGRSSIQYRTGGPQRRLMLADNLKHAAGGQAATASSFHLPNRTSQTYPTPTPSCMPSHGSYPVLPIGGFAVVPVAIPLAMGVPSPSAVPLPQR